MSTKRKIGWVGPCPHCLTDVELTLVKESGRWTLRELFTPAWERSRFLVRCAVCASAWPVALDHDVEVSVAERLGVAVED